MNIVSLVMHVINPIRATWNRRDEVGASLVEYALLLALIALHLGAVAFYELRGSRLTLPMVTGRAARPAGLAEQPHPTRPIAFVLAAAAAAAIAWLIAQGLRLHAGALS